MRSGKYRLRTALRENLPERLAARIPKGRYDCGDHEWYKAGQQTWRCYHCEPGFTDSVPWNEREIAARRLEAAAMQARALPDRADALSELLTEEAQAKVEAAERQLEWQALFGVEGHVDHELTVAYEAARAPGR